MDFLIHWSDALWILVALFLCRKDQKLLAAGYVVGNMIMMRLMAEMMDVIGYERGLLGFWQLPVLLRGLIVYHGSNLVFFALAAYSREGGVLFMAAALSMFFLTAVVFSIVMVL